MFNCPQNGILGSAESSNLSGEECVLASTVSNNMTICVCALKSSFDNGCGSRAASWT